MKLLNETVCGLLLKDGHRTAGSRKDEDGKLISWADGYVVTVLLSCGFQAADIKKYTARPDLENIVKAALADVEWGSPIVLTLENGKLIDVRPNESFPLD